MMTWSPASWTSRLAHSKTASALRKSAGSIVTSVVPRSTNPPGSNDGAMATISPAFFSVRGSLGLSPALNPKSWGLRAYQEIKHIHVGESTAPEGKIYFGALFN